MTHNYKQRNDLCIRVIKTSLNFWSTKYYQVEKKITTNNLPTQWNFFPHSSKELEI